MNDIFDNEFYKLNFRYPNPVPDDWAKVVGEESTKSFMDKYMSGFWKKFCFGNGLDIGYKGYLDREVKPILPSAQGITLDTPNYNGSILPFNDNSIDYIYSSHVLEHIEDRNVVIKDWWRVLKIKGYCVCVVPHKWLYERKKDLPSVWNEDHKIFFTASNLCEQFEKSLPINSFRIRYLEENDKDHIYNIPVENHANGCYEITIVLEKIK